MVNERLKKVLRTCENGLYWFFLIANGIFIIGNPIYCYIVNHSGFGVVFYLLETMLIGYLELCFLNLTQEFAEIEHVVPKVGTVFHLSWRAIWLTALVAFNEIVLLWLITPLK